jgi:hypothetical protein
LNLLLLFRVAAAAMPTYEDVNRAIYARFGCQASWLRNLVWRYAPVSDGWFQEAVNILTYGHPGETYERMCIFRALAMTQFARKIQRAWRKYRNTDYTLVSLCLQVCADNNIEPPKQISAVINHKYTTYRELRQIQKRVRKLRRLKQQLQFNMTWERPWGY